MCVYKKSEREMTNEALQSYRKSLEAGDAAGGFTRHLTLVRAGYRKRDVATPVISDALKEEMMEFGGTK